MTHLAIGFAAAVYFLPLVNNELVFFLVVMATSLLPDADSGTSRLGKKKIFRPLQMISKHRGFFHTYTFAVLASLALALVYPIVALPFFLGYSFHLLADSFTPMGIRPFWPFKGKSTGIVKAGGPIDKAIFITFIIIDIILAVTFLAR